MIFITFKYRYRKQILIVTIIIILIGSLTGTCIWRYSKKDNKLSKKKEEVVLVKKEKTIKKNNTVQIEKYSVDIKGEVINPGIYSLDKEKRVIDQTTPNMIQRISRIFERKPLISKEI